jgi:hypothetical protein
MLFSPLRDFTDGVVSGFKGFVQEAFLSALGSIHKREKTVHAKCEGREREGEGHSGVSGI